MYDEIVCGRGAESIVQGDSSLKKDLEKPPKKRARTSTTGEVSANPLVPPNEVATTSAIDSKNKSDDKDKNSDLIKRPNKRVRSSAADGKSESPPVPKRAVYTGTSQDSKRENDEEATSSSDGAFLSEISKYAVPGKL